ncbi:MULTISPECIES: hypothetical protein [Stutzerimonas]|jgi:hypothetical protein|uniref:PA0061/PA0062 family lipoprotein n=1 Tax=Stutzerimonas TaxID=2901164 RepID=UPI0005EB8126|nr:MULTISPECIES: hypothetical protein [Stutzerimonas]MBA4691956.1 hypothetical protein [Pseudomonas sp.]MCJ0876592.1 hypothetical protein [Pseudomonas sp. JI-2]AVX15111.1 hypothetical protein CXB48_21125 [Stutzerimonas stutzeri]KOR10109.1 lipoprotein [Stutzerimonas stutzeri]MBD9412186.1 hypothetical protein [Stutzerimonas stutzeri]
MRQPLSLALFSLLLAGCAGPLPQHDPNMAWVDLRAQTIDVFMSDRLDGKRTHDGRYFQVPPGSHELEANYEFEVSGGGPNLFAETQTMRCTMVVRYDQFEAGKRYLFQARSLGFTPQGWLLDEERNVLVEAKAEHCR